MYQVLEKKVVATSKVFKSHQDLEAQKKVSNKGGMQDKLAPLNHKE